MKSLALFFAVLQYIPSSVRKEAINVGIAVHVPENKYSEFFSTKNYRRVSSFDDEYDSDFFKMMMESFHYDIDSNVPERLSVDSVGDEQRFDEIGSPRFLNIKTDYLSNEFIFLPVNSIQSTEKTLEKDIDDLKRTYLYYDRPRKTRISSQEVRQLLSKHLKLWDIKTEPMENTPKAQFVDKPFFDFKINDKFVKTLSFDYANESQKARELKSILFDLNEITTNGGANRVNLIVNDDASESSDYNQFTEYINKQNHSRKSIDIKISNLDSFLASSLH